LGILSVSTFCASYNWIASHSTLCVYVTINSWTPGEYYPISNIVLVTLTSTFSLDIVDYIYTALIIHVSSYVGINVILNCRSHSSGRSAVPVPTKQNVAKLEIHTRGRRHDWDDDIPLG
jgi:hypothetical protein